MLAGPLWSKVLVAAISVTPGGLHSTVALIGKRKILWKKTPCLCFVCAREKKKPRSWEGSRTGKSGWSSVLSVHLSLPASAFSEPALLPSSHHAIAACLRGLKSAQGSTQLQTYSNSKLQLIKYVTWYIQVTYVTHKSHVQTSPGITMSPLNIIYILHVTISSTLSLPHSHSLVSSSLIKHSTHFFVEGQCFEL